MKPNTAHLVVGHLDWCIVYAPDNTIAMDTASKHLPTLPRTAMSLDNDQAPRYLSGLKGSSFHGAFSYQHPAFYLEDDDVRRNDGTPTGVLVAECQGPENAKLVLKALLKEPA